MPLICRVFILVFGGTLGLLAADALKETDAQLHSDGKGWRVERAVVTDATRPRVLLIGDSILNGYLSAVIKVLEGKAYVDAWVNPYWQSAQLNQMLSEVLTNGRYDVIHFNMGLHGWPKGRIQEGAFTPLTQKYVEVLKAKQPQAKLIWASTTPVLMKGQPALNPEINSIILEHNRLAAEVMTEMNVPVNDLYSVVVTHLEFGRGDGFHWQTSGYELLGKAVSDAVIKACAADSRSRNSATVPESAIAKALVWQGVAIQESNYCVWGASPVIVDGKVHLFAARWPEANVDPAWRKSSEIAHYVADRPDGHFIFQSVILQGSGRTGEWDAFAPHNPEIQRFGDKFVLCYIANSDFHQPPHPFNQQIGMVVSDSVNGPWKKAGRDGLILGPSPDPNHFTHGRQIVNPSLLKVGNKFYLYFKTAGKTRGTLVYGVAIADEVTGPYRMLDQPVTREGVFIEDATAFWWKGKICLLTTDNLGKVTGVRGAGALWVSDDGIHFQPEKTQLGFDLIPRYYPAYDSNRVKRIYGSAPKFERPKVLCLDGQPAWLYATSGWNVTGGDHTVSHVLKINLQPGDAP